MDGYTGSSVGSRGLPPLAASDEKPSCFGVLMTATSEVAALRSRIESLVEKLCGSVPTQASTVINEASAHPGSGLLPIAERRCRDVMADVNATHAALDRLEKILP